MVERRRRKTDKQIAGAQALGHVQVNVCDITADWKAGGGDYAIMDKCITSTVIGNLTQHREISR